MMSNSNERVRACISNLVGERKGGENFPWEEISLEQRRHKNVYDNVCLSRYESFFCLQGHKTPLERGFIVGSHFPGNRLAPRKKFMAILIS